MDSHAVTALLVAAALLLIFAAGCTTTSEKKTEVDATALSSADETYTRGLAEYADANYRTAEERFTEAYALYAGTGDQDKVRAARDAMFRANRTHNEYPFDTAAARASLQEKIPGITDENITDWMENHAQKIVSENETLYFYDLAENYLYANFDEMRKQIEGSLDFDFIARYAWAENRSGTGPYVNPVHYAGTERLEILHEMLPATGTLKIWYPLPVETESQRNVTVANLSYPEYIVAGPFTTGGIGYVYYEIPVEEIAEDLTIAADIEFISYEQIFDVDPALVGEYDTNDPEYLLYTASERNIEITDAIREKALEIVGNETNPHLQAQMDLPPHHRDLPLQPRPARLDRCPGAQGRRVHLHV
ncbi:MULTISPECIES: hypothetical protein [unclassified Methanoculleus]|jgi:hypothetical protein|uniref:hypothetical protein n=2 Tax=Methanoculleus TaxID=45989 RepID=UPI0025F6D01E|nr:hypothetical protein [Methanoculleus sp. UBA377]MDD2473032.1 hypothetical protein [Methanoculleus sp.]